jgi:hypothetical protein
MLRPCFDVRISYWLKCQLRKVDAVLTSFEMHSSLPYVTFLHCRDRCHDIQLQWLLTSSVWVLLQRRLEVMQSAVDMKAAKSKAKRLKRKVLSAQCCAAMSILFVHILLRWMGRERASFDWHSSGCTQAPAACADLGVPYAIRSCWRWR